MAQQNAVTRRILSAGIVVAFLGMSFSIVLARPVGSNNARADAEIGASNGPGMKPRVGPPVPLQVEPQVEIETASDPTLDPLLIQTRPFQKSMTHVIRFPFEPGVLWLRFRVHAPSAMSCLLAVGLPYVDRADLYASGPTPQHLGVAGRAVAFPENAYPARLVAFPLAMEAGESRELLMRIEAHDVKLVPIELTSEEAFREREGQNLLIHGIYLGVAGSMILYNLFLFIGLRDRTYLYYTLFGASIAIITITESGYLGFYGGPWFRSAVQRILALLTSTAGIFGLLFARIFLDVQRWNVHASRLYLALASAFGVSLIYSAFTPTPTALPGILLTCPLLVLNFTVGIRAMLRGDRAARLFMLAFTAFLAGLTGWMLVTFGVIEHSPLTIHGYKIGSAMEMILLSLALADRINVLRNEREEARQQALDVAERSRMELEDRVAARTAELSKTNGSLQRALEENRVLLREVHHRVKNNMQVMLSLLRSRRTSQGKTAEEILADARERIKVISTIHSRFCESDDVSRIELSGFVRSVSEGLARSLADSRTELQFDLVPVQLDLDRAMSCGLILNELVTNALKHAALSPIRIALSREGGMVELVVEDSGSDPADLPAAAASFGLTIVRDLAEKKLHGSFQILEREDRSGVRAGVRFPSGESAS